MTPEEIWQTKSDEALLNAARQLIEYSEAGQAAIVAEVRRRGLNSVGNDNDEGADSTESVPSELARSPRLLSRVWRGDESLPRTFWLWGVLGTRVVLAVLMVASAAARTTPVLLFGFIFWLMYVIFVVVAIWRSSARYEGPRGWADLARVSLALNLLWSIGELLAV